jgi:beta-glucanase (GH16 family)
MSSKRTGCNLDPKYLDRLWQTCDVGSGPSCHKFIRLITRNEREAIPVKYLFLTLLLIGASNVSAFQTNIVDCNGANNNVPGLDTSKWVVIDRSGDYSNNEMQGYYGSGNVSVSNGSLILTAKEQAVTCHDENMDGSLRNGPTNFSYTSGAIQAANFSFTYGTMEFRAKMPSFQGMWPGSLWLLGQNCQSSNPHSADNIGTCAWDSAGSNEIDIAEFVGTSTTARNNIFDSGAGCRNQIALGFDASQAFHVYSMVWLQSSITFKVDGNTVSTCTSAIPSTPLFPIINLALGGSGGTVNGSQLPQSMYIDYVKVLDQNNNQIFFDDFTGSAPAPPTGLTATPR